MSQITYQEQFHPLQDQSNLVQFPSTGRSFLRQAIEGYQQELSQIKDCAPANTWVVSVGDKGLYKRTKLASGKITQRKLTITQRNNFEEARARRDRKVELTVLIDELARSMARGL